MSYETEGRIDNVGFLLSDQRSIEAHLGCIDPATAAILERSLEGQRPSVQEGAHLLGLRGQGLSALVAVADRIRHDDVGDIVTYVVNRNVNWTNICFVGCKFCAFAHLKGDHEAYDRSLQDMLERIEVAIDRGATEVCMQGGLNPEMPDDGYLSILRGVREAFPDLHIHAYSPMEVQYGARRMRRSYSDYIAMLMDAGLGSMPGTAAEILDDDIREILSHKKLTTAAWVEIISTAHRLGLPTTSTVMYGHIETPMHIASHIGLLGDIQMETGGFTEFVPLRFIWQNTALYREGLVKALPQGQLDLAVYATSRLMLRGLIDNLQTSWVKIGHELSTLSLMAGCNDIGGTLMEESISREAGADAGEYTTEPQLRSMIRQAGRIPRQRNTVYGLIDEPGDENQNLGVGGSAGRWSGGSPLSPGPGTCH